MGHLGRRSSPVCRVYRSINLHSTLFFFVRAAPASVIAAPAIESACCVTYLEYYETPGGEHTPVRERGVLKHARCFDSPPVLHITPEHLHRVCCAKPPNTPPHHPSSPAPDSRQLNSTGLYNPLFALINLYGSVFMFAPRCFSWKP